MFFTTPPPRLLRRGHFFERKNVGNSQESGVRTRCAAIASHCAIVNLLRVVNLLRRSILSTAGSFVRRGPFGNCDTKQDDLENISNQKDALCWELRISTTTTGCPESKKRKSSEANSGSIHPYGRYENAVKIRKTISTIAILWPVKAILEKRAARWR